MLEPCRQVIRALEDRMVDIATGLTQLSHALKLVKELNNVDREFDKADLKIKIAELAGKLVSFQTTLADAREAIAAKDVEISRLKDALKIVPKLAMCDGFLYGTNAKGEPDGHPYCPRCHTSDSRFMRTVGGTDLHISVCPECKQEYYRVNTEWWEMQARAQSTIRPKPRVGLIA
jgi:hypothetical protein